MTFKTESEFESAVVDLLTKYGWESDVLTYSTEADLLKNWADILFSNNNCIDRLNNHPLTDGEMQQILEQITNLRTPLKLNTFINGKTVSVKRDNTKDTLHFGKEIDLKIYDRDEIAAGQSRYQIVRQPKFTSNSPLLGNRRGDVMLLINGMPVIHIELKRSGIPVSQAYHQIEKYAHDKIFTGVFSLVQIFVAMEPNETRYFANPGPDGTFNPDFYFHWANFDNVPINEWSKVVEHLLSIPMAHQMIGFYTVADDTDGILKVMRSYQYYAANAISDKVAKTQWGENNQLGGYIWHTTGSGKTMTSFKSAQLIANSKDADKVVFLMDRIELGTQSLREYRGFAGGSDDVQATENTGVLVSKLKSDNHANTLIVTSIQKLSNIKNEEGAPNKADIEKMNTKRIVFIVDEAHRSVFGEMLKTIKDTFPGAIFFGFTGTPIHDKNKKKMHTTANIFGDELHRYVIADGIRDKNVLGFDPYKVLTFQDRDVRKVIALAEAKARNEEEALQSPEKRKIYYHYMSSAKVKMSGAKDKRGKYIKGIEDYLPESQYKTEAHTGSVVKDILDNWKRLSHNNKFHALFATHSIAEAIKYYQLIKEANKDLKITCLFDPKIDNNSDGIDKSDGLEEILRDYNALFSQSFALDTHSKFKKDVVARLSHKKPYERIEVEPDKQLDLLIVVDQMLTGFDSKWVNTLYMDKVLKDENVIQAFSRTNRIFGPDKPFGTIRYYRRPHTMERNIEEAVKLYSGDRPYGLFVKKLEYNLGKMNEFYKDIDGLFTQADVSNFTKLPDDKSERGKFAKLFKELNYHLEAAEIQGFRWNKLKYEFSHGQGKPKTHVELVFDQQTYLILAIRYKELFSSPRDGLLDDVPYDLDGHLTEIDTGVIDADYMNTRFSKFMKLRNENGTSKELVTEAKNELHQTFATLTQAEQKYAKLFLHDIESGDVKAEEGKTLRDYITEYKFRAKQEEIAKVVENLGVDAAKLRNLMSRNATKATINDYGYFDKLIESVDKEKAKAYFEKIEGKTIATCMVNVKVSKYLREFVLSGGVE